MLTGWNTQHFVVLADAEALPFRGDIFDLVIAVQVIGHVLRPELRCKEISQVLKLDDKGIITTGDRCSLAAWLHQRISVAFFS
jgi:SAM-dependent methyltransferase